MSYGLEAAERPGTYRTIHRVAVDNRVVGDMGTWFLPVCHPVSSDGLTGLVVNTIPDHDGLKSCPGCFPKEEP